MDNLNVTKLDKGVAKCPFNPHANITTLMTENGKLFIGSPTDFMGTDPAILRADVVKVNSTSISFICIMSRLTPKKKKKKSVENDWWRIRKFMFVWLFLLFHYEFSKKSNLFYLCVCTKAHFFFFCLFFNLLHVHFVVALCVLTCVLYVSFHFFLFLNRIKKTIELYEPINTIPNGWIRHSLLEVLRQVNSFISCFVKQPSNTSTVER